MANCSLACWVYFTAITSHFISNRVKKQNKNKKKLEGLSLKLRVPRNPVHVQMAELLLHYVSTSFQPVYPVLTQ